MQGSDELSRICGVAERLGVSTRTIKSLRKEPKRYRELCEARMRELEK